MFCGSSSPDLHRNVLVEKSTTLSFVCRTDKLLYCMGEKMEIYFYVPFFSFTVMG